MNKKIKNAFNDIKVNEDLERKILNMTINKKDNQQRKWKLSYTLASIFLVGVLSLGVVYAQEIKNFITSFSTNINVENNKSINLSDNVKFKNISSDALKVDTNNPYQMNYDAIEKNLGFKILKLKDNNTDEIYYSTYLNDNGQIGRIDLWIPYFVRENDNKYISVSASMLNKNADEKYILAFKEGLDASGGKDNFEEYHSNNLNTKIIVYSYSNKNENSLSLKATFVYDDILYIFTGKNMNNNELVNYINKLEL